MPDSEPVAGIPLAYAQIRSQSDQQLATVKQTIFAASSFLAILGLLPEVRLLVVGFQEDVPVIIISLACLLSYVGLGLGSFLGLLRAPAGTRLTIISLATISIVAICGSLYRVIQRGRLRGVPSGFWYYYLNLSLPTLWILAFAIVAIVALTRRSDALAY